ncbi:MAG: hypothetical protein ABW122_14730 [Ilumatobacteraceae bacterium]
MSTLLRKLGVPNRRALARFAPADATIHDDRPEPDAGRLPRLRARLLGRSELVANIDERLTDGHLTTLIGPGGVGKTSVALAVAHRRSSRSPKAAVFVDLVPARDESDVVRAFTIALGIEGDAARSAVGVADHLRGRSILLVLDNCEHVIDASAAVVNTMLAAGGDWQLLATSRQPLGLWDEQLVPIEPLGQMAPHLFVDRAQRLEPRIAWDPDDPQIIELCDRLDGLPLAIELAAGQVRRWSLADLLSRLADPASEPRVDRGDARHQAMSAAIGWSYALLGEPEQRLLRHLGVFPSSFRLDALEALRPLLGDGDLVGMLGALVDKSLVARELDVDRYRLLETIRIFAVERLESSGEIAAVLEHHRCWILDVATGTSHLDRWFSGRLAARTRADGDDVRQAFRQSLAGTHLHDAVELAIMRSFLWRNAVGCAEGHEWLDAVTSRDPDDRVAAWVALLRCDIAQGDGDFFAMISSASRAAALMPPTDRDAIAIAEHFLMLQHLLDASRADQAITSALQTATDERFITLLRAFALVPRAGHLDDATLRNVVGELESSCSADGYERYILNWAMWLHGLALRDDEWARRGIDQQYDYLHAVGLSETWLTAYSLAVTQMIDGISGRSQLDHALELADHEGYHIEGDCLLALAYSESCANNPVRAAELLALARTRTINATAHHVLRAVVVEPLVRRTVDPETYKAAVRRGSAQSVHDGLAAYGIERRARRSNENVTRGERNVIRSD